jgi:hypothetical protein
MGIASSTLARSAPIQVKSLSMTGAASAFRRAPSVIPVVGSVASRWAS